MAVTYDQYLRAQQDVTLLSSRASSLQIRILGLQNDIREIERLTAAGQVFPPNVLANAQRRLQTQIDLLNETNAELAAAERTVAEFSSQPSNTPAPPVSTGAVVSESQVARDDQATTQTPESAVEVLAPEGRISAAAPVTVPSNAARPEAVPTAGTNDPIKPVEQTQTVPSPRAETPIKPGSPSNPTTTPVAPQTAAAAAPKDDNSNGVVSRVNDIFGGANARIVPQTNVLDKFSNYTYTISIYLTDSDEYRNIATGQRPNLSGSNLLIQSGGAAVGQRNQEFPLDFYIDDLVIKSIISGKGTGGGHNSVNLSFRLYEPYGVTFLDRLAAATRKFVRNPNQQLQTNNYAAQAFLMVIRFYGYDENGELVRVANSLQTPGASQEPGLIVEKYIPFRFTEIKFRLAGKIAEYDCQAVALRDYAPASQTRGIIPYNIELTSVTLKELLGANLSFSTANRSRDSQGREPVAAGDTSAARQNAQGSANTGTPATAGGQNNTELVGSYDSAGLNSVLAAFTPPPQAANTGSAPPKATAAPRPTLVTGLAAALNEFQAELVRNGTYTFPDVYEIVINESILQEARLQPPEAAAGLRSVPMTAAQSAGAQKLGIKQSVNRDVKNVAAAAGMSIVQFLDQIVRNSSYILDQQTKIWRKDSSGKYVVEPRATGGQLFAWYRIGMDAVPIREKGIDPKRGDYAYRITYSITPYLVNDSKSAWFPQSRFSGTHKRYDYWFTGLNTSIVNYEQTYNYLYYITMNGGQTVPSVTSDYREYEQYAFQARAPEASQGAAGPVFDPAAQAASVLYSPGDTAQINLQILGDPAWIQQGEIVSGVPELGQVNYGPFLPNGTINYDSREVLFEVAFNTAGDYSLETGLMDVARRSI
jgi:hypothetical protein